MTSSRLQRLGLTLLAVMMLGFVTSAAWGYDRAWQERDRRPMTFDDMRTMRHLYSSLLPVARLRNDSTGHYLHFRNTLKMVTTSNWDEFGQQAGLVNFRKGWHPKPYSTHGEDNALFRLGVLVGLGHFTMVNSYSPEMKEYSQTILKMLSTICTNTRLADLAPQYDQIAQAVADPSYTGGPTKVLDQYDALAAHLADAIEDVYLKNGFWYYSAGVTLAGLHAIPGHDWFNAPYFRDMLAELYNHYPQGDIPYTARYYMGRILRSETWFHNSTVDPDSAQKAIWGMYGAGAPM